MSMDWEQSVSEQVAGTAGVPQVYALKDRRVRPFKLFAAFLSYDVARKYWWA